MSSARLARLIIAALFLLVAASGCGRKIVRPDTPQPSGPVAPQLGGSVMEQDVQAVQAGLKVVYFDYDSPVLSPQAQADLQYNAEILKRAPNVSVVAEGHCDERGTAEYNLALGDRRARAVVDHLVSLGVPPPRFSTVSYGAELPVDPAHDEAAWAKNRRVHLGVSR
jgi:peptidoglycan-associated lipoprotein